MLGTLIEKEWKSVLLSPKFALTFAASTLLILLSIGVGIREYHAFTAQQESARALLNEELQEYTNWHMVQTRAFREADPLQILVSGVHNDVGRLAPIHRSSAASLEQSVYSDDPVLAIFRSLDLTFIVQAVLSLFAILFTYDAINGERESGTLRLVFSGAVPRARFVLAKFLGTWLGLALPLALPLLLGLLAIVLARVPLSTGDWQRLGLFLGASALYLTLFLALGIAVSAWTKKPSTSFLILLTSWVVLVLVVPRAALLSAIQMKPVPTVAQVESRKAGFERRAWENYRHDLEERWRERRAPTVDMTEEERDTFEDENLSNWMEEDDKARKELEKEIADNGQRLTEELRNQKQEQERLALQLSRFSPASAFRLAAMSLAGTDVHLKARYEEAARDYKEAFSQFITTNSENNNRISMRRRRGGGNNQGGDQDDEGGGQNVLSFGGNSEVNLDGMPEFVAPRRDVKTAASGTPIELGLLIAQTLACLAFGFMGFMGYDVR